MSAGQFGGPAARDRPQDGHLERASGGEQAGVAVNTVEPATEQRPLIGLRVLAVDDNPLNLRLIGRVLEQQGANVAQARDGQAALHLLRSRPGDFHLVLMDVQMPVMNGLEATRAIRGDAALTAGVLPEERAAALDAGMNDFLAKPLKLDQLLAALKPYLNGAGK